MSEIQDLEAYENEPPPIETAKQGATRRNYKRANLRRREMALDGTARRKFYATRNKPSLPKLKCLEADHDQG